ncbi:MAG: exosortase E/protease, VPEID-CTERM system [Proteobacteria bacterium]|nr:exosortase E/protease, VPEID-CTERM system [Pseudomonadota bacterium]
MAVTRSLSPSRRAVGLARTMAWLLLALAEAALASYVLDLRLDVPRYMMPTFWAIFLARWAAVGAAAFVLLAWNDRASLVAAWGDWQARHAWRPAVSLNLLTFGVLVSLSAALTSSMAHGASPSHWMVAAYGTTLFLTALTLLSVDVPLAAFADIARRYSTEAVIAVAASLVITIVAEASTFAWAVLAPATLDLVSRLLQVYEPSLIVDEAERAIQVGNFRVTIHEQCSGYEGLALVAGFVSLYLYVFRTRLRLPVALLLYPAGLAAIWLLNAVRIVALTSLGAHVSPGIAAKGFHSQAGWITFLMVTLGLMAAAQRWVVLPRPTGHGARRLAATSATSPKPRQIDSYLIPFVALMIGSMAVAAAVPGEHPVHVVKALLIGAALWIFWANYAFVRQRPSALAIGAGIVVGAAWIATAPRGNGQSPLALWLQDIGPLMAFAWLAVRGLSTAVLVPIAEELAFRGFLYRRLQSADFVNVPYRQLAWGALIASSVAFGALHGRMIAAGLAGAVFCLVMIQRGRLSDAVWAHAIANGVIFLWAVAFAEWALL